MLQDFPFMLRKISASTRYITTIVAVIVLAIIIAYLTPVSSEYVSDKHSFIVNLLVLLFTVGVVERLSSYKALLESRRTDEQRLLGFNEILEIYLHRYLQTADAMTRPIGSNANERKLSDIEFVDMENMYNVSLFQIATMNKKSYQLYFEVTISLGELISQNLTYIYSSHYQSVVNILLALAAENNKFDTVARYETFKERERTQIGSMPTVQADAEFFQGLRSGEINQDVDFIATHSHSLTNYAQVYKIMKNNFFLIEEYRKEVVEINKRYESNT